MRASRCLVVLLLLLLAVVGSPSSASAKPEPRLKVKSVTATLAAGQVSVAAVVKNKARTKARAGSLTVSLSRAGTSVPLGTLATPRIKAKRTKAVSGQLAVPATASGSYQVLVCTPAGSCAASGTVALPVQITAVAGTGGTVALSGVTGGTCAGTTCTFAAGSGTVTFTPQPSAGQRFVAWTGCTGYAAGANGAISFTAPASSATCTATFVRVVTVSWTRIGPGLGTVTGTVTGGGTCTPPGFSGSCTTDAGVGSITLSPAAANGSVFTGWSPYGGLSCSQGGYGPITFNQPTASQGCAAYFNTVG